MRTYTVFGEKNQDFSVRTNKGVKPEQTRGRAGRVKFSRFCADVFYGRPF